MNVNRAGEFAQNRQVSGVIFLIHEIVGVFGQDQDGGGAQIESDINFFPDGDSGGNASNDPYSCFSDFGSLMVAGNRTLWLPREILLQRLSQSSGRLAQPSMSRTSGMTLVP